MENFSSFGYWVRRRRKLLDLTQADLADRVSCSLSMLRKIERDERRPSVQLAELLAEALVIESSQREPFLQMARGQFVPVREELAGTNTTAVAGLTELAERHDEQAPFVARDRQLQLLREHLHRAMDGQGRIVFISGEAGRGKTSLLLEFARQALDARPDLIVAGGSSDVYTGQGDPLLPFRDIFRLLVGDLENAGMRGIINRKLAKRLERALPATTQILMEDGPDLLGTLISGRTLEARLAQSARHHPRYTELLLRLQDLRARRTSSPALDLQQDRLFDEISSTLKALAQRQPIVLILDDLHWIDQSSAALLGHLAKRLMQSPILIVGSYRPEDLAQRPAAGRPGAPAGHLFQEVLSESLRQFGQNRIDLDHSEPGEELAFVNALLDVDVNEYGDVFREQLARLTEGHPLFVVELLRDMRERGDLIQNADGRWVENEPMSWEHFPARVEGVIEKRIERLTDDLRELLAIGSVQGEIFFAEVVARISGIDPRELTRRLSAVLDRRHRLVREQGITHVGKARLSRYRFRHHLFQKYLYSRLAPAERLYLHEAVGDALETLYEGLFGAEELPAAQLARHFLEARQSLKASRYLLLAGRNAARVIAYEEAAAHFEHGLNLLEEETRSPETDRLAFELSLALGRACWHGGHLADALDIYEKSIEIARTLQEPEVLARAALAYEEPRWRLNLDAEASQRYFREAMAALGEEESPLRVRLLVSLSRSLLASGAQDELRATVDQALEIARRIDDPVAQCDALRIKAQIDRRPETTADRLAAVQQMIAITKSLGDQERLADALDLYIYDMLELGHIALVDKAIATQKEVAEDIQQSFQLHVAAVFQTMRAILRGEFEEAERLANEAADISRQIGLGALDGILGIHMFTIRREQGRLHEVAPILKLVIAQSPSSASWRPGLALMYSTLGQTEACQAIFEDLASGDFAFVPQDSLRVATLAYLTEVCAFLEDRARAATLYDLLAPYDGRAVVVGGATACYGAVARYLGILATTLEDWQAAERHFGSALVQDELMGAWPWLAHSRYEYASMLLRRGQESDRRRAHALLDEALQRARQMGMMYLVEKVENLSGL